MIGSKRLDEIEARLDGRNDIGRPEVRDLCAEVRRLVKAMADIRAEKAKFDACKLRVEELDAVIAIDDIADRALDGYEVDDG